MDASTANQPILNILHHSSHREIGTHNSEISTNERDSIPLLYQSCKVTHNYEVMPYTEEYINDPEATSPFVSFNIVKNSNETAPIEVIRNKN